MGEMTRNRREIRQAVVLVGGFGTRLGALTKSMPKPLLTIAGRPFLDYLICWLAKAGVEDVLLFTGYLSETFRPFIDAGQQSGRWVGPEGNPIQVTALCEPEPAGTAGALRLFKDHLADRFFLLNGDSFFLCDPIAIARKAETLPEAHGLLTVRNVPDVARFGSVALSGDLVTGFQEKGRVGAGLINAGISVLTRDMVELIDAIPCSLETDIYPILASEGRLHGIVQEGYFIDIGLPETYEDAQTALPEALRRPAVFFDRDGVLNEDKGYTHRIEDLKLMPGAAKAVAMARDHGFATVVVTNQAGIARGLYTERDMASFHSALNLALRREGGWIDAFYHCPFHPDGAVEAFRADHPDRKPAPGMILRAAKDLDIVLEGSFLIGDKDSDIQAATAAGISGHIYTGGPLDRLLADVIQVSQASAETTPNDKGRNG